MMKKGPITATFIDEITYDIPSSNWSPEQWAQDLDNMMEIGIDTLVIMRGGFEDKTIFPSKVFGTEHTYDFAGLILEEAAKRNMDVFFGLYCSNLEWDQGNAMQELRRNKPFIDEIWLRYGHIPSFKGWYIPQETSFETFNICDIMHGLSAMCKDKAPDTKVFISPFFRATPPYPQTPFNPERHYEEWDRIFTKAGQDIDICAFQDGTAPMSQMAEWYRATAEVCKKHSISHWVNVETFERDVRSQFYPIPFPILKRKIEMHKEYAEKMITFEFSHFLSPQSIYPSARNLNNLYKRHYLNGENL